MSQHPRAFCKSLAVVDFLLEGPVELALIGTPGEPGYEALRAAIGRRYLPNRIVAHHDPAKGGAPDLPLLAGRGLVGGKAALYVCRNFACLAPVTDPAELERALAERARRTRADLPQRHRQAADRAAPTPAATAARAARFVAAGLAHGYGPLGTTGLTVSRLGFGCYRVDDETPEHREALIQALQGGCTSDRHLHQLHGRIERAAGGLGARRAGERRAAPPARSRRRLQDRIRPGPEPRPRQGARGGRQAVPRDGEVHGRLLALHPPGVLEGPARPLPGPAPARDAGCVPPPQPGVFLLRGQAPAGGRPRGPARGVLPAAPRGLRLLRDPGGRRPDRLVRRLLQHGRAAAGRSGGDLALPDAGGRPPRGRAGTPLPRPPVPAEPLRVGRPPHAQHRPGCGARGPGPRGGGGNRRPDQPAAQRLRRPDDDPPGGHPGVGRHGRPAARRGPGPTGRYWRKSSARRSALACGSPRAGSRPTSGSGGRISSEPCPAASRGWTTGARSRRA